MMAGMTRQEIEGIELGQTGLYPWNKTLPVCALGPIREVIAGTKARTVFRYVTVQAEGFEIGFIVAEGD